MGTVEIRGETFQFKAFEVQDEWMKEAAPEKTFVTGKCHESKGK